MSDTRNHSPFTRTIPRIEAIIMAGRKSKRANYVPKTPEQRAAETRAARDVVDALLGFLTEDDDAWQTIVNVCNLFGTSISEGNLLLMMAQYAGITGDDAPPTPFADNPHVPTDVRTFAGWVRVGRSPAKGLGVKLWEPRTTVLSEADAQAAKAKGDKRVRWNADLSRWERLTFVLGTRWDVAHTTLTDADAWANSDPRPAREGGAALAASIADLIWREYEVDVTIPSATPTPTPTRPRPRKRPTAATPTDTAPAFTAPERVYSGPLFGGATSDATPTDTASSPSDSDESDGGDPAPVTPIGDPDRAARDVVTDHLRSSGYKGKGFLGLTADAWRESADLAYSRAEAAIRGGHTGMITPEAFRKGIDPRDLFTGSAARAHKWATDDLRSHWEHVESRPGTLADYRETMIRDAHDTLSRVA